MSHRKANHEPPRRQERQGNPTVNAICLLTDLTETHSKQLPRTVNKQSIRIAFLGVLGVLAVRIKLYLAT
jgi:hypothetical protein